MDKKHIIKFENGMLYLKLREEFNTSRMELHHTMARVGRTGVSVVKTDSKGEVSSTSMSLNADEMDLLVRGYQMVQHYWEVQVLPQKHVLLECGCIVNWDEHNYELNRWTHSPKDAYLMPHTGDPTWCSEHEDTHVYRFNIPDFIGEDEDGE